MVVVSPLIMSETTTATPLQVLSVSDAKLFIRGGAASNVSRYSSKNRATGLAYVSCGFGHHHQLHIVNNARSNNRNKDPVVFQKKNELKVAREEEISITSSEDEKGGGEEEEFRVVTALRTKYNDIAVVDSPNSRILLLDSTYNVHSIINKDMKGAVEGHKLTGSYWDEFATLPAIVPDGPIAILGLGGGTCAHLMLDLWPSLKLEGWEIDQILIDKSREYFGLSDLEKCTQTGGFLAIHVGDALSSSVSVPGGYAGIVVDLFSEGKILPQLQEVTTWLELNNKLMTDGRIMVNCGGAHSKTTKSRDTVSHHNSSNGDLWEHNSTIRTLSTAFPGKLSWKKMGEGENYVALTGAYPDLDVWSAAVPEKLSLNVKQWRPCHVDDSLFTQQS